MSPQQFKAFLQLGQRFLEDYEKENGILNIESNKASPALPPEIVSRLQEALKKAAETARAQAAGERPSPPEESSTNERKPRATRRLIVPKPRAKKL